MCCWFHRIQLCHRCRRCSGAGGPRREFLQLVCREMLQPECGVFDETASGYSLTSSDRLLEKRHYFVSGLLCGNASFSAHTYQFLRIIMIFVSPYLSVYCTAQFSSVLLFCHYHFFLHSVITTSLVTASLTTGYWSVDSGDVCVQYNNLVYWCMCHLDEYMLTKDRLSAFIHLDPLNNAAVLEPIGLSKVHAIWPQLTAIVEEMNASFRNTYYTTKLHYALLETIWEIVEPHKMDQRPLLWRM